MTSYKQAIILTEKQDMTKGKMIAQACHASLTSYKKANKKQQRKWEKQGQKKIILNSGDQKLVEIHQQAKQQGIPTSLVKDAGKTQLKPGTKTAVGIGPEKEQKIDNVTGQLGLIK